MVCYSSDSNDTWLQTCGTAKPPASPVVAVPRAPSNPAVSSVRSDGRAGSLNLILTRAAPYAMTQAEAIMIAERSSPRVNIPWSREKIIARVSQGLAFFRRLADVAHVRSPGRC